MPNQAHTALRDYLRRIESALKQGNATELTHRSPLETLLETLGGAGTDAINEPQRIACGAPDFIIQHGSIPLGYVEAKDVGTDLGRIERSEQLERYRESLPNLVLTDYLEFRWYLDGELRLGATLARPGRDGRIRWNEDAAAQVAQLLRQFLQADIPLKATPRDLATRMAGLARLIRTLIVQTFEAEGEAGELHGQLDAFRKVLIESLSRAQFADMYAQTLCYGLFAARCNAPAKDFSRQIAPSALPRTNPFLRRLFNSIAGADLDPRIAWAVDQLADMLARADMRAILEDFGRHSRREDPVVHFYETFLAAYDPKMREARGVYYTPEPVVGYIVRSVDALLKRRFKLAEGLAHSGKIKLRRPAPPASRGTSRPSKARRGMETLQTHRVQILDPATGTGTFLYAVIARIREHFEGNAGAWPGYVAEHLLPRLFGFELLMAPYAVAHMKLGLELELTGYDFASDQRLGVYLTDSLEQAHEQTGLPLFTQWLAEEAHAASQIKRDAPVMVVLGNPPYSGHSANTGEWITGLLHGHDSLADQETENYFHCEGKPLGERNPKWLNDDYVKFIRFAQWRIEQTGYGILAFVTNHGYLDNPTFRGMRESLLRGFDEIYLLDLHGNSKKKERAPDGGKDQNVFDIQQGVAIGIFVKHAAGTPRVSKTVIPAKAGIQRRSSKTKTLDSGSPLRGVRNDEQCEHADASLARVFHADLFGTREIKYASLDATDIASTAWTQLAPAGPNYYFIHEDAELREEYAQGWKITEAMPVNSLGIATARDSLAIQSTSEAMWKVVQKFVALPPDDARTKFDLGRDSKDWNVKSAQADLEESGPSRNLVRSILYRPFDVRFTYFTGRSRGFQCRPRGKVMGEMLQPNLAISLTRSIEIGRGFEHVFVSRHLTTLHTTSIKEVNYHFPLWLYPRAFDDLLDDAPGKKTANFAPEFVAALTAAVGDTPAPEDTLAYLYAVLYAPSYRSRYGEFLKRDFPRVPLTSHRKLFDTLIGIGHELIALHTMDKTLQRITGFPVAGSNEVVKLRWAADSKDGTGRLYINAEQYFDGVPQHVWDMHIGGYRVAEKWLKDRKGRPLSYDDLSHYQAIIAALARTLTLQAELDAAIENAGGWPLG